MKPTDFSIKLYDAGVHTLINSVAEPLVALQDADALRALTGYLTVLLAQADSLSLVTNEEALQVFVLHAQRAGLLDVEFLDASFQEAVRRQVPKSVPVAPDDLHLLDGGDGKVNASSSMAPGGGDCELQQLVDGRWETVAMGVITEAMTEVEYEVFDLDAGTYQFRIVVRSGSFPSFPGAAVSVDVA